MADLRTRYLGMELRSPLVASSSPLTGSLDGLRRLEAAGAGAVVLPSVFEEEIAEASPRPGAGTDDQAGYGAGPAAYLALVSKAREALEIPVVASLNGVSRGGWASYASRLEEAGANGLILFNRFYQPDLDIEAMEVQPALELSSSVELRLPLRWIAILHRRHRVSLAASTGVHTATDVLKVLLAGANVAMMTSALLRNGPEHVGVVERELRAVLATHEHDSVAQLRGSMSRGAMPDPAGFERANYVRTLMSWSSRAKVSRARRPGTSTRSEAEVRAGEIMTSPAITVTGGTSLKDVAALLVERGINAVPVVDALARTVPGVVEVRVRRPDPAP